MKTLYEQQVEKFKRQLLGSITTIDDETELKSILESVVFCTVGHYKCGEQNFTETEWNALDDLGEVIFDTFAKVYSDLSENEAIIRGQEMMFKIPKHDEYLHIIDALTNQWFNKNKDFFDLLAEAMDDQTYYDLLDVETCNVYNGLGGQFLVAVENQPKQLVYPKSLVANDYPFP